MRLNKSDVESICHYSRIVAASEEAVTLTHKPICYSASRLPTSFAVFYLLSGFDFCKAR